MNVLTDILFLIVIALIVFIYTKRGFFKSLIRLVKSVLVFVLAYALGGKVASLIAEKWISAPVREAVFNKINQMYLNSTDGFNAETILESLPSFAVNAQTEEYVKGLDSAGSGLVEAATDAIAPPITSLVSSILGYVLVFVVAFVLLSIAAWALDKLISKISILNLANRLLGALLGLVFAFILSVLAASLLRFFFADSAFCSSSVAVRFFGGEGILNAFKFLDLGALFSRMFG